MKRDIIGSGYQAKSELPFHIMLLPAVILVLIYSYGPMFGVIMAFQKFNPVKGFFRSPFVGFKNFIYVFKMPEFTRVLSNTLIISVLKIAFGFFVSTVIALLLNEITAKKFRKFAQTAVFMPYFISWAILGGIFTEILAYDGIINSIIRSLGGEAVLFLQDNTCFRKVLVISDVWKNYGYNMIIFLSAITNIDPTLYEASNVDGAGKWKQAIHITIPGIKPVMILMATLSIGGVLNAGFEQILLLYNPVVYQSGDVIDTFVYRLGIFNHELAPAAAVGLFKSVISLILVGASYYFAYKKSNYRIF